MAYYELELPGGIGSRYCSMPGGDDHLQCICNVGGVAGYPRVPEFDLVCTDTYRDGCLGSQSTKITSTNSAQGKKKVEVVEARKVREAIAQANPTTMKVEKQVKEYSECKQQELKTADKLKVAVTVLANADLSNERKMSEIWKIPSPLLPCKDFITTIMAATPEGTQGKIKQKAWKPVVGQRPGGVPILAPKEKQVQMKEDLVTNIYNQFPNNNEVRQCNALLVVLGENLEFGDKGHAEANVVDKTLDLEIFGREKQKCAVRLYTEDYDTRGGKFTVNVAPSNTKMETIHWAMNKCVTEGGEFKVSVIEQAPEGVIKGVDTLSGSELTPYVSWPAEYGNLFKNDTQPALIFVPGVDIVNPTYDSLTLYRDNLPFYAMPSWIEKNKDLLQKNGFDELSWMQLVIFDLSYKYLNARQFQSLFTDLASKNRHHQEEYRAVLQFYMGVNDENFKLENIPVPVDVEALEKEEEAQEKMYQKYLKTAEDGTKYIEIPWDTVKEIKDESKICETKECDAGSYLDADGLPKDKSCALCSTWITPFLATLFWTAKQSVGDHKGGLRRRLQIDERFVVPAGNYMYVDTIYTLFGLLSPWGGAVAEDNNAEWVRYGTHTVSNVVRYSTPSPNYNRVNIPGGGCWANTIFKLVMYLSKHKCIQDDKGGACFGWDDMNLDRNNISTFALLNHSIPSRRRNYTYSLDPIHINQADDAINTGLLCPPNVDQWNQWLEIQKGNSAGGILRYFDFFGDPQNPQNPGKSSILLTRPYFKATFPNDACWQTEVGPIMRQAPLHWLGMTHFARGNLDLFGSTNLWDYTRGGESGVDEGNPEANPPLIWDKCCADSCYKPCSEEEQRDGCSSGSWPQSFFPRFKFTNIEHNNAIIGQPARMPRLIPEQISKLINTEDYGVLGATIRFDPYFLRQLAEGIDFRPLWNRKILPGIDDFFDPRDDEHTFNYNLSSDQLAPMLNPVVDAMECQSYRFNSGNNRIGPSDNLQVGTEFYVSSYPKDKRTAWLNAAEKAKTDTAGEADWGKHRTWGPFKVIELDINYRASGVDGVIVLNSNDVFGRKGNVLHNKWHFFLHQSLAADDKRIELTSKLRPAAHSVTIVGYKSSGINAPKPEPVETTKKRKRGQVVPVAELPQRFSDANKSKVNYFILDLNVEVPVKNSYVLMPMPSVFEITQGDDDGVPLDSVKTVFNSVASWNKRESPYSVSVIDYIFSVKLNIIGGPQGEAGQGAQDLRPSGDTGSGSSGSEPVWPLFLAVALCVAVIVIWKRGGSSRAGRFL